MSITRLAWLAGLAILHTGLILSGVFSFPGSEALAVGVPMFVIVTYGAARRENGWLIVGWVGSGLISLASSWPLALVSLFFLHIGKFTDTVVETIGFGMVLVGGPEATIGLGMQVLSRYFEDD